MAPNAHREKKWETLRKPHNAMAVYYVEI